MTQERDPARVAAIRAAYDDGQLAKVICSDYAISRSTLYRIIDPGHAKRQGSQHAAMRADFQAGLTKAEIARKYRVAWLTAHRAVATLDRLPMNANTHK